MDNIWDVYLTIKNFIADKTRNGVPTPENIGYGLDMAQQDLINYLKPLKEKGDDMAATALSKFLYTFPITSTSTGRIEYPLRWASTEAIYETVNGEFLTLNSILDNELYEAKRSVLYPIAQNPRYIEQYNGVQCYPETTHNVQFKFFKSPESPKIGYTVVGNTQVFDPTYPNTVELAFDKQYWSQIIQLSMPYVGVNLSSQEISSLRQLFNPQIEK